MNRVSLLYLQVYRQTTECCAAMLVSGVYRPSLYANIDDLVFVGMRCCEILMITEECAEQKVAQNTRSRH